MKRKIVCFLFSVFFFLKGSAQCAMCRAVLESEESQNAAEGINDGILFLMAVPYILVAAIGYFIYRKYNTPKKIEITD
ncbi:hypothetical protein [Winogradskyella sp. PG-2]|uniref:hypothetical protein n=1 Tax=Winogradskyella sp. PG-2 TaxID=754409 RepID=UPI0005EF411D|nr:hypothetical protein [Winogradskyella sp. PG-2]